MTKKESESAQTASSSTSLSPNEQDFPSTVSEQTQCLTEKNVYDFIWGYLEEFTSVAQADTSSRDPWERFWKNRHTQDYLLIRPSGNPLNLNGLIAMFESGDISDYCEQIIAVESIKILGGGSAAVMVFKSEQIFRYKGELEEDITTQTMVLVWEDSRPKITSVHRGTGKQIDSVR